MVGEQDFHIPSGQPHTLSANRWTQLISLLLISISSLPEQQFPQVWSRCSSPKPPHGGSISVSLRREPAAGAAQLGEDSQQRFDLCLLPNPPPALPRLSQTPLAPPWVMSVRGQRRPSDRAAEESSFKAGNEAVSNVWFACCTLEVNPWEPC